MIVFVDYEHADGHQADYGERLLAARTWITYRLEDVSGQHCMLVRYNRLSQELLDKLEAKAIFISGNSIDPNRYQPESLEPLHQIIRQTSLPVFGFCGGFQAIAQALGSSVVPITPTAEQRELESMTETSDGNPFEFGYYPVELIGEHELLDGLGTDPVFRHAHGLHVPEPPADFVGLASTEVTKVQMAVDDGRKIVGTQFHPEYWTDEHPAGRTMIANFVRWASIGS